MSMGRTSLFVGDLAIFCTEIDLERIFSPYGQVLEIKIMRSEETYRNLSYGFIKFALFECARQAMMELDGVLLCGRPMRVRWATFKNKLNPKDLKQEDLETSPVHVSFISYQISRLVTEQTLRALFGRYGEVVDVSIKKSMIDKEIDRQSGYGFVHYSITPDGVQGAILAAQYLQDTTIDDVNYKASISHNLNRFLVEDMGIPASAVPTPAVPNFVPSSNHHNNHNNHNNHYNHRNNNTPAAYEQYQPRSSYAAPPPAHQPLHHHQAYLGAPGGGGIPSHSSPAALQYTQQQKYHGAPASSTYYPPPPPQPPQQQQHVYAPPGTIPALSPTHHTATGGAGGGAVYHPASGHNPIAQPFIPGGGGGGGGMPPRRVATDPYYPSGGGGVPPPYTTYAPAPTIYSSMPYGGTPTGASTGSSPTYAQTLPGQPPAATGGGGVSYGQVDPYYGHPSSISSLHLPPPPTVTVPTTVTSQYSYGGLNIEAPPMMTSSVYTTTPYHHQHHQQQLQHQQQQQQLLPPTMATVYDTHHGYVGASDIMTTTSNTAITHTTATANNTTTNTGEYVPEYAEYGAGSGEYGGASEYGVGAVEYEVTAAESVESITGMEEVVHAMNGLDMHTIPSTATGTTTGATTTGITDMTIPVLPIEEEDDMPAPPLSTTVVTTTTLPSTTSSSLPDGGVGYFNSPIVSVQSPMSDLVREEQLTFVNHLLHSPASTSATATGVASTTSASYYIPGYDANGNTTSSTSTSGTGTGNNTPTSSFNSDVIVVQAVKKNEKLASRATSIRSLSNPFRNKLHLIDEKTTTTTSGGGVVSSGVVSSGGGGLMDKKEGIAAEESLATIIASGMM